jgi:superfamily I DNA/RNA helicase
MVSVGTPVDRMVAVTFTHAAAGEMKWRVRQGLDAARLTERNSGAVAYIDEAPQHLDRAFIGTIHSFCAQLLRQRPVEARVDPSFQELDQGQAYAVFADVFRAWVERKLSAPCPVLERALTRLAWRYDAESHDPLKQLRDAAWNLIEWRDHPAPWARRDYVCAADLDALLDRADAVLAMRRRCSRPDRYKLYAHLRPLADCLDRVRRAGGDYDLIESDLLAAPAI